ncbi:MAG: glycosyl hydrolase [Bacteroidota bacterium]
MKTRLFIIRYIIFFPFFLSAISLCGQNNSALKLEKDFKNPPASAKPWVFWYWMQGAVSKEGITADLEAMQQAGIGGAYLMPIKDTSAAVPFQPVVRQLTPEWWAMVNFSMQEAKRLHLQLAMHVSDGFALAGGPWIKPEMSMQKIVWTKDYVAGGTKKEPTLEQPETIKGYYKDIAVFAYPARSKQAFSDTVQVPTVTTSNGAKATFLCFDTDNKESFKSDTVCWIQYRYPNLFTCRSVHIRTGGNNYQAQRLIVQACNDGMHFKTIIRLTPARSGWQDTDEDYTYTIPATTARYFRFVYDKEGTEPGSEDLDAAKWKPTLRVSGIYLDDEPVINQYEAKNGSVWRIAINTTAQQVTDTDAVPLKSIVNLTGKMDIDGKLHWTAPAGNWVIVRIGHTSNGHTNATGGAGKGLECDKFDPVAIKLQFDNWFGKAFEKTDKDLAQQVLKIFHADSWECGSQNWSHVFQDEFKRRRGYDLTPYLLTMTGVPVESAAVSEKFLHDIRETISELVADNFYAALKTLAHQKHCLFTAESVAPTMLSDGMLHYKNADIPMGEFWLNSPTHDKPNDMLDAISGGHIYGKQLIQAEAFTSVRMNWGEHPGNLKITGDRNFAFGINKMVLHVFVHNPWMDRKPGMTLDGIGVYFQRDQTWWKQGKAWISYLQRCQSLLQTGKPVVDIAVFTGEEAPRRSLLPDRLINTLPGIFGKEKVAAEIKRLKNEGTPMRQKPDGVTNSANIADPEHWVDPLNGYAYDSFNPDALLRLATVKNGRIELPGGANYAVLVIPYKHAMEPNTGYMSVAVAKKIQQLIKDGATVLMSTEYNRAIGLQQNDEEIKSVMEQLVAEKQAGKGKLINIPFMSSSFAALGLEKDVEIINQTNTIAWTHRQSANEDIYFLANQKDSLQEVNVSFRAIGRQPEWWNAVTGEIVNAGNWHTENSRTYMKLKLDASASVFVVFRNKTNREQAAQEKISTHAITLNNNWKVKFDSAYGGLVSPVVFDSLTSWSNAADNKIKYYSGSALYTKSFEWKETATVQNIFLSVAQVENIATIKINGKDCGTLWTPPYRVNITTAIKPGINTLEIAVANTWANRLIGDNLLPDKQRITWTNAPFRLKDKPLLKAGILGDVRVTW